MPSGNIEEIRATWREDVRKRPLDAEHLLTVFNDVLGECKTNEDFELAEEIREELDGMQRKILDLGRQECPIGFFKPSWEQAQILNAWSPQFEPDAAENGYQSVGIFSANRIGKSCAVFINTLLWLIPNDPEWVMFEEHEDPAIYDESGSLVRASRGKYTVFPRPSWEAWKRTGRMIYPWRAESPMGQCEVWHGCENDTDWNERICGRFGGKDGYLAWMPRNALGRRSDGQESLYKQERRIVLKNGSQIVGKTYNSEDQAWAGKAVRILNMDEGFEMPKLIESTTRVEAGGYYLWAYTPTEARNIGRRTQVAYAAYRGDVPLVGKAKFFTNFRMEDAPEHVLPAEKKQADIARFKKLGKAGESRMNGGFFESSPRVFANFDSERNVLPIDGSDVLRAIKGHDVPRWAEDFGRGVAARLQDRLHLANIIRGMDEGLANPTACCWVAILPSGEYLTFREWEEAGLSITERCAQIIDRSGNVRELIQQSEDESKRRYREVPKPQENGMAIRRTFADSKMFRRNPESPSDDMTDSYRKAGLKLERAANIGPAKRCDEGNDMLRADPSRKHLLYEDKPGCRAYVTRDCEKLIERFENYLWQQVSSGQRAGEFTDRPESKDDHTLDSWGYAVISKLRWLDEAATASYASTARVDPLTGYVLR